MEVIIRRLHKVKYLGTYLDKKTILESTHKLSLPKTKLNSMCFQVYKKNSTKTI